jgi:hypothetical protein
MAVGVYPGTFNPLTVAHLAVADAARRQCGLDRVDLVISRRTLGKHDDQLVRVEDRLAVIEAVRAHRPWLRGRATDEQLVADIAAGYDVVVLGADKWAGRPGLVRRIGRARDAVLCCPRWRARPRTRSRPAPSRLDVHPAPWGVGHPRPRWPPRLDGPRGRRLRRRHRRVVGPVALPALVHRAHGPPVVSPNREEPDRGPDHRKPVHARTTRRARATAITIALVLVGHCRVQPSREPRGRTATAGLRQHGERRRLSPVARTRTAGVRTTSGSVPGTSPGRDQTTTTSTTTTTDPTS